MAKTVQRVNENVRTTVLIELSLLICGAFGVTVSHYGADARPRPAGPCTRTCTRPPLRDLTRCNPLLVENSDNHPHTG